MITTFIGAIAVIISLAVLWVIGRKKCARPAFKLPTPSLAVRSLISENRKIDAIKLYRQENGVSLVEAKQVIDGN